MVYMNDSSIFSDDFHNLHLLHKPSKGETKIHQQKNVNTMSNTVFKVGFLDFNFFWQQNEVKSVLGYKSGRCDVSVDTLTI